MSEQNPFGDIEQDNNPSFYGNLSVINDPYGNERRSISTDEDELVLIDTSASQKQQQQQQGGVVSGGNSQKKTHSHKKKANRSSANGGLNINDSLVISSKIADLINQGRDAISIEVISTEKLMNSSSVVVYCIELKHKLSPVGSGIIVKRRYSEFKSLRDNLMRLFPTIIIPPIPQKHTLLTYLITSINNNEEISIVETRKRLFEFFLKDLIFHSNERLKNCVLLHKFLDPNYEMCWENAINEPPLTLVPDNLLLASPIDPTRQNGLYSLLPVLNGYEPGSNSGTGDNLGSLKKLNEDLQKANAIARSTISTEERDDSKAFNEIPLTLIHFEANFLHAIKTTSDLEKLNTRASTHLKALISALIELGSNLNNFSLQIHSPNSDNELNLANQIEKFGSTIDSVFLNYESYTISSFIPKWQEPIHQLIQHYYSATHLLRFYKLKLIQFKLIKKSRVRKQLELESYTNSLDSQQNINEALKNGLELNSPSITQAVKRFEQKQRKYKKSLLVRQKKSWYGLFGGKSNLNSNLNYETLAQANEEPQQNAGTGSSAPEVSGSTANSELYATNQISNAQQFQFKNKIEQIHREIEKLDQLIDLTNSDMIELTKELEENFEEFLKFLEKRWLKIMLDFIRGGKKLFEENLQTWQDMKNDLPPVE